MQYFVEIRSYTLKPGTRAEFQRLFLEDAYPLLQRWNFNVVMLRPSLHDENKINNLCNRQMGGMGQTPFLIQ